MSRPKGRLRSEAKRRGVHLFPLSFYQSESDWGSDCRRVCSKISEAGDNTHNLYHLRLLASSRLVSVIHLPYPLAFHNPANLVGETIAVEGFAQKAIEASGLG